ncbi:hypothetical protein ACFOD1_07460 [Pseudidiomarina halophila]|uniref:Uncharacterized protein n=1 Tax=Pseudidiomarina halophila TaxID=1449799 RepID=A0A432XRH5_9GAMM|nr:hypothetical protein [Pseudidiomarina halophila]RUO51263.1 hypothetical protein CWI69_12105 [Pseudidiomarina halophila]
MRMFYYLKVFFFSFEFAFLVLCLIVYMVSHGFFSQYFPLSSLNDEAIQWVMLFPIGITVWTLKEGVGVLFPSEKKEKVLHEWPDYWKLKIHFDVGISNSIFFTIPCIIVWLLDALSTLVGAWIFAGFAGALSINAFSFYAARISLRSALIRLDDDNNYDNHVK